ncbi:hypothetical protein Aspvir_000848 [Aspergillus viridinutans]|uniref:Uncharacterized protein n=1 Tax=Aspergillus viridinutans TaxID=75553 RepID=A0A9P3BM29_ASPVI|nr:uncharacterized protein Aspvir_000848 [Aspergillus viridinutans]GIJ98728.1 hypothetical protein Aspvir_000848 [Aspergillus viridinutans]
MTDLPQSYQLRSFSSFSTLTQLQLAVKAIHDQLEQNNGQGNQWLVIMATTSTGSAFGWEWQTVTLFWGLAVTTPGTVTTHGKQPDNCFFPPNRQPLGGQFNGWPSLVIETGVSESLEKLRRDATWWFQNSSGDTRIVILISIKAVTKQIRFEKWQLAPPNLPRPTRQAIAQLRQQPNLMPPLVQQQANSQTAFCHQEVIVTPTSITGGPLVIPFRAMFDRQPTGAEGDIVINNQGFRTITRFV